MNNQPQPPSIQCDLEIFRQSDYHNRKNRHLNSKTFKVVGNDLNTFNINHYSDISNINCSLVNDEIQFSRSKPSSFYFRDIDKVEKMLPLQSSINHTAEASESQTATVSGSITPAQKQYYIGSHSFIQAAVKAYSNHHHLVIRPDDIWIAIMTQLSSYITGNAEALRSKIVDFQGKKNLEIIVNATLFNAPYDMIALEFSNLISKNIKDPSLRDWVIPNFSTTNTTDRVVGSAVLMASMKEFFNYAAYTKCNLPAVTMMGTIEDWKSIKVKAQRLMEFSLSDQNQYIEKWLSMLNPILDKFIETMELPEDKIDTAFWNSIVRQHSKSGASYLDGWITVFTIFSPAGKWNGDKKEVYLHYGSAPTKSIWPIIESADITLGYSQVDIKIIDENQYPSKQYDSKMISGAYSIKLYDNYTTIVPQLNWSIFIKDELN